MRNLTNHPDHIARQRKDCVWILITALMVAAVWVGLPASGRADTSWDGTWFTCEFAQRQRAPDDGCAMFDDEGFSVDGGKPLATSLISNPSCSHLYFTSANSGKCCIIFLSRKGQPSFD